MSRYKRLYREKLASAQEIVSRIKSGDICCCPTGLGEPPALVNALAEHVLKNNLRDITHHMLWTCRKYDYLKPELAGKITHVSWFTSASSRQAVREGRADFMPNFYYEVPRYWMEYIKPDVFYAVVSPMDKHGYFSFGCVSAEPLAQMARAGKIFLEVNPHMPRVFGSNIIHISQVDGLCEDNTPLFELPVIPVCPQDQAIGDYIAELIPDGSTLQLGIGGVPNAVGNNLMSKKDLGLHTEMITESMIDLMEAGVVNNSRKSINRGKTVTGFAFGSRKLYDYVDNNPAIEFHPISYVNDPRIIGRIDKMVAINACLEVDLIGQVCSESIGGRNYSATGGQLDFVRGCNWSKGGCAVIATFSTAKDDTLSRIRPTLSPGAHVTVSKNDVDWIITEYGKVRLKGKSAAQRAKALISIAHPKFRDELSFAAKKMGLMI